MALEFYPLKIASIEPTAVNAVCVTFHIPAELENKFEFNPGQHLTLRHEIDGEKLRRFYSICSSQSDGGIRIGVRGIAGGRFSNYLNLDAKVGDELEVLAPRGRFCLEKKAAGKPILAFGAGSGITPIYSILSNHLMGDPQSTATLVYGNQSAKSIMLRKDLNDLKDNYMERFQIIHMLSREQQDVDQFNGRVNAATIEKLANCGLIDPANAAQILICGPGDMIDSARNAVIGLGATDNAISIERFTAVENRNHKISAQTQKAVESGATISFVLDGMEKQFAIENAEDSVLEAAQKAGFELPFSCAGGMCATCRCKLVDGKVEMAVNYALEPWELEAGFVLACQSRPKTTNIRLDFDAS